MKYLIIESIRGYSLIDITKTFHRQENYVIDDEGIIKGKVIAEYNDPLESISELIMLESKRLRKSIMEEVSNERY